MHIKAILKTMWRYKYHIFISVAILFGTVFLLNLMIITEAPFEVAQDNDWIGFWGGLIGSILSGIITLIVLKITINNEDEKRKNDKLEIEKQRLEDRRMSVLPYLSYYIDTSDKLIEKELRSPILITPNNYAENIRNYTDSNGVVRKDKMCKIKLIVENLGLGIAIDPSIVEIKYDGLTNRSIHAFKNMVILNIGEKSVISTSVCIADDTSQTLSIKIGYFNLLRDYYEQQIKIGFSFMPVFVKGENNQIVSKSIELDKAVIESISKAVIAKEPEFNCGL